MPYVTEQTLTDVVRERWSDIPDPRLKQVMTALVKHAHAFVREIEPTQAEWATAIDFLTRTGQMCDDKRQEFILLSDVLGISMLVDAINHRQSNGATPSTVEGPFHVPDAPAVANGGNMAVNAPGYHGLVTHLFQSGDKWIENDAVYGVKEPLIVDFEKKPAGSKAPSGELMNEPFYVVRYDFVLDRKAQAAAAA